MCVRAYEDSPSARGESRLDPLLVSGSQLLKYGRSGAPHFRHVGCTPSGFLYWAERPLLPIDELQLVEDDLQDLESVPSKQSSWFRSRPSSSAATSASRSLQNVATSFASPPRSTVTVEEMHREDGPRSTSRHSSSVCHPLSLQMQHVTDATTASTGPSTPVDAPAASCGIAASEPNSLCSEPEPMSVSRSRSSSSSSAGSRSSNLCVQAKFLEYVTLRYCEVIIVVVDVLCTIRLSLLRLANVIAVTKGKETSVFRQRQASATPDSHCFSVITSERSLDLQTTSPQQRDAWVNALTEAVACMKDHRMVVAAVTDALTCHIY